MKYKIKLNETLSDIVYHLTYVTNVLEILKSNTLELTAKLGTPADSQFNKELYYLSFSSVKFGGYGNKFSGDNVANIVFDGRKLNYRYKSKPVDYWGREYRQGALDSGNIESFHNNDEEEQRLLSNKPEIPNAYSYIKEIHINLSDTESIDSKDERFFDLLFSHPLWEGNRLRTIIAICEREDIPLYIYFNFNAFKVLDKRKAYTKYGKEDNNSFDKLQSLVRLYYNEPLSKSNKNELKNSPLILFIEQLYKNIDYNPEYYNKEFIKNLFLDSNAVTNSVVYGVRDYLIQLENEIHSQRKDPVGKKLVSKLMEIFYRNKKNELWQIFEIYFRKMSEYYSKEDLLNLHYEIVHKD